MKAFRIALMGVAASTLMVASSMAADLVVEPAIEEIAAATSWDGLYIGVQGNYDFDQYVGVQGVVGANFTVSESFLIGVEGAIGPYFDVGGGGGNGYEGYLAARLGFVVDDLLLYGLGGVDIVDGSTSWVAGAGAEFMVADSTSLRVQVLNYHNSFWQAGAGLMWHFN